MFEGFKFARVDAPTDFITLNDDDYPFTANLDTHFEMGDHNTPERLLSHGRWPAWSFMRKRIWNVQGDIVGFDASDYSSLRLALLSYLESPSDPTASTDKFTHLIHIDDTWYSYATLINYSMAVIPLYPSVNPYMIEWESDDPYCYTISGDTAIMI